MAGECWIIGVLDSGPAALTAGAAKHLAAADLVIASSRFFAMFRNFFKPTVKKNDLTGKIGKVHLWITEAQEAGQKVVVLASGDPLCYGIAGHLRKKLPKGSYQILGAVSNMQLAFERLQIPWQGAARISVHSGDQGEWKLGAPANHPLTALRRVLATHEKIALFTSPVNGPDRIARMLITAGFGEQFTMTIAESLGAPAEQLFTDLAPAEVAIARYNSPNVVVLLARPDHILGRPEKPVLGLVDSQFERQRGMITKQDVRAIILSRLALQPDDIMWDIGAGSGSVGLEAARLIPQGQLFAIEKDEEAAKNIAQNREKFGVHNYHLHVGKGPSGMEDWPAPNAVFIGGSGGNLAEIITICWQKIIVGGRLILSFVSLDNLNTATETLNNNNIKHQLLQVQLSHSEPLGTHQRLVAQNPVWIVLAEKI